MAVYRVEKGEWAKVAADLAAVIDWAESEDQNAALGKHGFTCWDELDGVYDLYRITEPHSSGPLAGVKYVFSVNAEGELSEDILVGDWLPDYLHVVERLEVLVRRHAALGEYLEAERKAGRLR